MKRNFQAGMTILELMVVISISAIVVTAVLTTWNQINKHVAHQEIRAMHHNESVRVADEITLRLRRSPGVIDADLNSIIFIGDKEDTLEYTYDGQDLLKNGEPVLLRGNEGKITSFTVNQNGNSDNLLLEITITTRDAMNNFDTVKTLVNTRKSRGSPEESWLF